MMIKIVFTLFLFSLGISNDQIPGEDQKRPIILKGGILHTVSTDVFEHVESLDEVLSECYRVLKGIRYTFFKR